VPDGVQIRFRQPAGARGSEFNDQKGTLTAVRRTRADVDFGGVAWDFPLPNFSQPVSSKA
jgi:hypothetical protein